MRKSTKFILVLAAIGAAVGALYAYFSRKHCADDEDLTCNDPADDSFDSDDDSAPAAEREYVPLNQTKSSEDVEESSEES